jgi:hypothetical protein
MLWLTNAFVDRLLIPVCLLEASIINRNVCGLDMSKKPIAILLVAKCGEDKTLIAVKH